MDQIIEYERQQLLCSLAVSGSPFPDYAAIAVQRISRANPDITDVRRVAGRTHIALFESVVRTGNHFANEVWSLVWVRRHGRWVQ